MSFLQSIWSFLSVVVIAWLRQRIISYWEKRKKIEETKLSTYMSWQPFLAECYARAAYPDAAPYDSHEFVKKKMEILGTLQIMGPSTAIDAMFKFSEMAERGFIKDKAFDGEVFHRQGGGANRATFRVPAQNNFNVQLAATRVLGRRGS